MNYNQKLILRAEYIIEQARISLINGERNEYGILQADSAKTRTFKSGGLSFILDLYGKEHPYFKEFTAALINYRYESNINGGVEIIKNIIVEIENGWISTIKNIISAEIFSDFLEMAEHLLASDYKDAAAVMIGGVLEEHLRQLCIENTINVSYEKDGKSLPLKADRLNSELAKAGIYNKLDQKGVTTQLDLRNNAAHGNYGEYDKRQVEMMYDFVFNFLSKYQIG
ncbi:MAG: hypothetical protein H7239_08305 [Flavobacterium sp.]|nr:hypothetical protein [Flavobacterium sp.]